MKNQRFFLVFLEINCIQLLNFSYLYIEFAAVASTTSYP